MAGAQLPRDERPEQHHRHGEPAEGDRMRPTVGGRLDDGVGEADQPSDRQQRPGGVQGGGVGVARVGHQCPGGHQRGRHDGDVDQEHRPPPEVAEQPSPDDGTKQDPTGGDPRPDADRPSALALGEGVGDDRKRRGHDQRGAHAHGRTGGDERPGRAREGRRRRPRHEGHQPGVEGQLAPEPVPQAAPDSSRPA